uniref:Proteasome activator PA28 N-terminal domain-containing protein n=1 Tax=Pelusios castaneus TaxID=367368 RepID=A0A8C8RY56_9SAUR
MAALRVNPQAEAQVDSFRTQLCTQAEALVGTQFPSRIVQLDAFLKDPALNVEDLKSLRAPLDIPIPDPAKEKAKAERRKVSWGGMRDPHCRGRSGGSLPPSLPFSLSIFTWGRRKRRMRRSQRKKIKVS